ncbi:sugar ABC transporter ATP-binding protein [Georgenia thermotolerans]|uniref:ATP-binding cassette domain-containing protein n=1 Tax=Georgenia thermotolerans TaxID=527326 RepID=A0A7J5UP28_9MICO|nr:sugar ABC transporter ATP-binding protein [Georgenia thermotolerans]KAE8763864.1 ATP-binding cassette domain-containing protein [Georgenia thermotolerans]
MSATAEQTAPRLTLTGITKRFGGVRAIRNADLRVMPGEVHALVGENGAGKSTLIKILSGAEALDSGEVRFEGAPVTIRGPADALRLGVATVYQEAQLFPELTVAENIFLGRELRTGGRIDWAAQNEHVVELLERLSLPPSYATRQVGTLSAAHRQQVSIAKALSHDAKVLILDEPSAILTDAEIEVLFTAIRRLTAAGVSIIYITHRLDEIFTIADVVTVMRDGETVGTYPAAELDVRRVAELMVGGVISSGGGARTVADAEPRLRLEDLASDDVFHDVDLSIRPGEVVALYGLVGSGVAEIASAVYGMQPVTSGAIRLDGTAVRPRSPRHARDLGIALLPADRKREGLFSFQSVAFNVSVGNLPLFRELGAWMDRRQEREVARRLIGRLAIKTPDEDVAVANLSGGNAQKVVLARQLVERPKVLVLAEPTQGVDIGAKEEIHRIIDELAAAGTAVLVATSDLSEATRIADRLVVIRAGAPFAEFGPGADHAEVLAAAAGHREEAGPGEAAGSGGATGPGGAAGRRDEAGHLEEAS